MDNEASEVGTSTIDEVNTVESLAGSSKAYIIEGSFCNGEVIDEIGHAGMALTRVDLDLAWFSEKLFNLDVLMMNVANRESDFEAFASGREDSVSSVEKALEFDLLSGILDSEVKELDSFLGAIKSNIFDVREIISSREYLAEFFKQFEAKLLDCEESLKQSQEQVVEMVKQSDMLQRTLSRLTGRANGYNGENAEFSETGRFLDVNRINMHTAEQRTHVLRMLEKSLARELDLEKKLIELRHVDEDLKRRLQSSAREVSYIEDEASDAWQRFLEAENIAEILMGTSKDLLGDIRMFQFNLNGSIQREHELKSQLENSSNLFKDREIKMESALQKLNERISVAESRADSAEDTCKLLAGTNLELNKELNLLKSCRSEKEDSLERKIRGYDLHLHQALATVEASQEKENMFYSTIRDMESVIDNLKLKVSEAESRADSTEDKCIILSEANADLKEELSFLRTRLGSVEEALHKTEETKVATVRDIGIRTKIITSLVMQLAMERERLQDQISGLDRKNTVLEVKLQKTKKILTKRSNKGNGEHFLSAHHETNTALCTKQSGEDTTKLTTVSLELNKESQSISVDGAETTDATSELDTVRRIDAGVLSYKHILIAVFVLMISSAIYMLQKLDVRY